MDGRQYSTAKTHLDMAIVGRTLLLAPHILHMLPAASLGSMIQQPGSEWYLDWILLGHLACSFEN